VLFRLVTQLDRLVQPDFGRIPPSPIKSRGFEDPQSLSAGASNTRIRAE
jgi:hypothetical protein